MVLGLLRLNLDTEGRVWKGFPWDTMERLHDKGMMGNPVGKAKTRMAALGCVFTQHKLDEKGTPLRDHESTTYMTGFESHGFRHRAAARSSPPRNGGR